MAPRLQSGHLLRIPLWHGWGFAYAKYLNVAGLHGNDSYGDLLKIFDYRSRSEEPLPEHRLHTYLLPPVLWADHVPTLRAGTWSVVGKWPLLPEDGELPDLRVPEELLYNRLVIASPPRPGATLYTKNLALRPNFETAIANAAHLGTLNARGSGLLEISTTMAFMQQEGAHPGDYFNLYDPRDRFEYERSLTCPLANTLPRHLYGRVCQPDDPAYVPLP